MCFLPTVFLKALLLSICLVSCSKSVSLLLTAWISVRVPFMVQVISVSWGLVVICIGFFLNRINFFIFFSVCLACPGGVVIVIIA